MGESIAINVLSAKMNISSRTLRHWEEMGLFKSARDPQSGWRMYGEEAIKYIRFIDLLRRLDLSLEDIKTILEHRSVDEFISVLKKQSGRLKEMASVLDTRRILISEIIETIQNQQNISLLLIEEIENILLPAALPRTKKQLPNNKKIYKENADMSISNSTSSQGHEMKISVIKKKFLLAGFEIAMDLSKGFADEMLWIQSELKRTVERISDKTEPMRLIGFWQPWQAFMAEPDPLNLSKCKYFFGVEVSSLDGIPSCCVAKAIPESEYALCREQHRGTAPKAEMYAVADHMPNYEIAGDFEIFDDFGHLNENDPCDVLVPIKLIRL